MEAVSLTQILSECQSMMEHQARERGVGLMFPIFDQPVFVLADRTRLKQIVLNLVSNAIKYNREHGTVTVRCTVGAHDRVRLSVQDTGLGLSATKLAQLFQPFNRLGQEAGSVAGTGIGLVVSKRLAEGMGGVLGVESTVAVGSTFWCEMSAAEQPTAPMLSDSATAAVESGALADGPHRTVLYVEDNSANMQVVEEIFERFPHIGLLTAVDASLGIALARSAQPHVILMDINLPGIDGFRALEILRDDPAASHIPVVALSATAMESDIQKGLEAGFFRYVTKPIKLKPFIDTLGDALAFTEN
jgi:CheY-like chemotaxis protein